MYYLPILFLFLISCGQDENGKDDNAKNETQVNTPSEVTSPRELQSLSLDKKEDLPDCLEANQHQLAYIISEETFYVCDKEWQAILIKGEKGEAGVKGETGQTSNSANIWSDPVSGTTYLLGGDANWNSANSACSGLWRLPSEAEGLSAGLHGIRAIAQALGLSKDFWENQLGVYIGVDGLGNIAALPTSSSNLKAVFCVR